MNELVSVIVPAFNVEKYLPKCIDSLINQTYKNLDIIIVNDGSTDKTGEIADKYAKEFENIRCIHKINGGLSDARNAGLHFAKGEYVVFFDSDDWVECRTIEDNLQLMKNQNVEIVVWGYYSDFLDENEGLICSKRVSCSEVLCISHYNADILLEGNLLGLVGYAWNKMYSMELLKNGNFYFEKGLSLVEDIVFNVPVMIAAKNICFNNTIYTHYMQRGRVTLGNRYYDDFLELKLLACNKRKELLLSFGVNKSKIDDSLWINYFYSYVSTIRMINRQGCISKTEKIEKIKLVVKQWLKSSNSKMIKTNKLQVMGLYILLRFRLYRTVLKVIK